MRIASAAVLVLGSVAAVAGGVAGAAGRTLGARSAALHVVATGVDGTGVDGATRDLGPDDPCRDVVTTADGSCLLVQGSDGPLLVTVEPGPPIDDAFADRPWVVQVLASGAAPGTWVPALSTRPDGADPGPIYAGVTVRAADVTGDGHDEVVIGYRNSGTGDILELDVVGWSNGRVRVLADDVVYKGSVRLRPGSIVEWTPVYRSHDANCCPTWIARDVVTFRDGKFHVRRAARVRIEKADVPPSDIG